MPTHRESRNLPYSAEQMFDLVADIARYPDFLPWCSATRIRGRDVTEYGARLQADLVISFKLFRERFGSEVALHESERRIVTRMIDGPFEHMQSEWQFRPTASGCEVVFFVDYEFRNPILKAAASVFFLEAMQHVVRAFERRAAALY